MKKITGLAGKYLNKAARIFKILMMALGIFTFALIILSFTDQPFWIYYWLGTSKSEMNFSPDYIVVMGAGGMPGPDGLMRCHFAARAAKAYPNSKIIIALPVGEVNPENNNALKMAFEIAKDTVGNDRFLFETEGTNTYSQACNMLEMLANDTSSRLLVVTSPEHVYRSVLTFKKCGFRNVSGFPAFERAFDENLLLTEKEKTEKLKNIDRSLDLRYNMWNYLKIEIILIREFFALTYYKIMGYI